MAVKEKKDKKTVGVGVEALWRAMAKDTVTVIPKIMPSIVRSIEVIEGDGGLGSVLLFNLGDREYRNFLFAIERWNLIKSRIEFLCFSSWKELIFLYGKF